MAKIPGRCTFTATNSPVLFNLARYTCAKLAAATGCSLISSKNSPNGAPNSFSMIEIASVVANGFTESCKIANSFSAACGNTSGLTLIICPALIYVGPNRWMISLASFANDAPFLVNSSLPPCKDKLATRVKNGTDSFKNSSQRCCNAPPCFFQYV